MAQNNKKIVKRETNFADWYTSIINEANLIQYTDIKGSMIFKPNGWAIWENIKEIMDKKIKEQLGVSNVSMPCLIPIDEFEKEKEQVEGFAPEFFTIDKIGEKTLDRKLVLRPTSEIWFCKYFENNIQSYNDLPIKINQWCNVFRAEKNTRPFLRNSEFFWKETHAAFSNIQEADQYAKDFLDVYASFCENELALPVIKGEKTPNERFPGADTSYTIEAMMQDGQALQSGTSHFLGQNFAKAYNIKFQDSNNELKYVYTTSHGLSTRIIGAIIMVHSDDNGLVLPFSIAKTQIRIIALYIDKNQKVDEYSKNIYNQLKKLYRCELVNNNSKSIGYLLSDSEVSGTPINIIIGPQDVENNTFTLTTRIDEEKQIFSINDLINKIEENISSYQTKLYNKAKKYLDSNIIDVNNFDEFQEVIKNSKWARCYFDGSKEDEQKIKELTSATARCVIDKNSKETKNCFYTNKPTNRVVIFAKAY